MDAEERFSAMNISSPWRGLCVLPTPDLSEARIAAMFLYSGFPFVPIPTLPFAASFRMPARPGEFRARSRPEVLHVVRRAPLFIADPRNRRQ